ncbi:hypothetical protein Ciccas_006932 [Cichlidogyrus casuarinus]|uniref:Uncharacterized protein n=1 Tax=Cichlidogyrus casuarinus TaxID=1844966 RepID=A0ABD2Q4V8_9PLAT
MNRINLGWPTYKRTGVVPKTTEQSFRSAMNNMKQHWGNHIDLTTKEKLFEVFSPFLALFCKILNLIQENEWNKQNLSDELQNIIQTIHYQHENFEYGRKEIVDLMEQIAKIAESNLEKLLQMLQNGERVVMQKVYQEFSAELCELHESIYSFHPKENTNTIPFSKISSDYKTRKINFTQLIIMKGGRMMNTETKKPYMFVFEISAEKVELVKPKYDLNIYWRGELDFIKNFLLNKDDIDFHLIREYFILLCVITLNLGRANLEDKKEKCKTTFGSVLKERSEVLATQFNNFFELLFTLIYQRTGHVVTFDIILKQAQILWFYIDFEREYQLSLVTSMETVEKVAVVKVDTKMSYMGHWISFCFTFSKTRINLDCDNEREPLKSIFGSRASFETLCSVHQMFKDQFLTTIKRGVNLERFTLLLKFHLLFFIYKMASNAKAFRSTMAEVKEFLRNLCLDWYNNYAHLSAKPEFLQILIKVMHQFNDLFPRPENDWSSILLNLFREIDFFSNTDKEDCQRYLIDSGNMICLRICKRTDTLYGAIEKEEAEFKVVWTLDGRVEIIGLTLKQIVSLIDPWVMRTIKDFLIVVFLMRIMGTEFYDKNINKWRVYMEKKHKLQRNKVRKSFLDNMLKILRPADEDQSDILTKAKAMRFIDCCNLASFVICEEKKPEWNSAVRAKYAKKFHFKSDFQSIEEGEEDLSEVQLPEVHAAEEIIEEEEEEEEEVVAKTVQTIQEEEATAKTVETVQEEVEEGEEETIEEAEEDVGNLEINSISIKSIEFKNRLLGAIVFAISYKDYPDVSLMKVIHDPRITVNGWKIEECSSDIPEAIDTQLAQTLLGLVATYIENGWNSFQAGEHFDALLFYLVLSYCSEETKISNKNLLSELPEIIQTNAANLYEHCKMMLFSSGEEQMVDIHNGFFMLNRAVKSQGLYGTNSSSLRVKTSDRRFVSIFDFNDYACYLVVMKKGEEEEKLEDDDVYFKFQQVSEFADEIYHHFKSTIANLTEIETKIMKIEECIFYLVMLVLCIRDLMLHARENELFKHMHSLISEFLKFDPKIIDPIIQTLKNCVFNFNIPIHGVVGIIRNILKTHLYIRTGHLNLSSCIIYYRIHLKTGKFSLSYDVECLDIVTEIEQLVNHKLQSLKQEVNKLESVKQILNILLCFIVQIKTSEEDERANLLLSQLIEYLEKVPKCKITNYIHKQVQNFKESFKPSDVNICEEYFEKYCKEAEAWMKKEIEEIETEKLNIKQFEQVPVTLESGVSFFVMCEEFGLMLLDDELKNVEQLKYRKEKQTIEERLRYFYTKLAECCSFINRFEYAQMICLLHRVLKDIEKTHRHRHCHGLGPVHVEHCHKDFDEVWQTLVNASKFKIDQLREVLKTIFNSEYGYFESSLTGGRSQVENMYNLSGESRVPSNVQFEGKHYQVQIDSMEENMLEVRIGVVTMGEMKMYAVIRQVNGRLRLERKSGIMEMFFMLVNTLKTSRVSQLKEDKTLNLIIHICLVLAFMLKDKKQRLVKCQNEIESQLNMLVEAKNSSWTIVYEALKVQCMSIFMDGASEKLSLETMKSELCVREAALDSAKSQINMESL